MEKACDIGVDWTPFPRQFRGFGEILLRGFALHRNGAKLFAEARDRFRFEISFKRGFSLWRSAIVD
jgi:hypothetical protein